MKIQATVVDELALHSDLEGGSSTCEDSGYSCLVPRGFSSH